MNLKYISRIILLGCFLLFSPQLAAAGSDLVKMEYFFNEDPGMGNGISVPVNQGSSIDRVFTINLNNLESGMHRLYVRTKNSEGIWSQNAATNFVKLPAEEIIYLEYYINNDPGFGRGISVPVNQGSSIDRVFTINLNNLESGMHRLYVRTKNSEGVWSQNAVTNFVKLPAEEIIYLEYYINNDPGFGRGISVPVTPGSSIDRHFVVNLNSLQDGYHKLFVRTKNREGLWGNVVETSFIKQQYGTGVTMPNIVKMEYFLDNDPGFGNGTPISVSPATMQDKNFIIPLSGLNYGNHTLYIRAKNEHGQWSITGSQSFQHFADNGPNITAMSPATQKDGIWTPTNQVILETQSLNFAINSSFSSGNPVIYRWRQNGVIVSTTNAFQLTTAYESSGYYTITAEIYEGSSKSGISEYDIVKKARSNWKYAWNIYVSGMNRPLIADFAVDGENFIVANNNVNFSNKTIGSTNNTVYEWDFNNDSIVDSYDFNPICSYSSAGNYTIKLTVKDRSLTAVKTKDIVVRNQQVFADFTSNVTCQAINETIQFSNRSYENYSTGSSSGTVYEWDFNNDGIVDSNVKNPVYSYTQSGTYSVKLTLKNGSETYTETKEDYIQIFSEPDLFLNEPHQGNFKTGDDVKIIWNSKNQQRYKINLYSTFDNEDELIGTIIEKESTTDNSYTWKIPDNLNGKKIDGDGYKIGIILNETKTNAGLTNNAKSRNSISVKGNTPAITFNQITVENMGGNKVYTAWNTTFGEPGDSYTKATLYLLVKRERPAPNADSIWSEYSQVAKMGTETSITSQSHTWSIPSNVFAKLDPRKKYRVMITMQTYHRHIKSGFSAPFNLALENPVEMDILKLHVTRDPSQEYPGTIKSIDIRINFIPDAGYRTIDTKWIRKSSESTSLYNFDQNIEVPRGWKGAVTVTGDAFIYNQSQLLTADIMLFKNGVFYINQEFDFASKKEIPYFNVQQTFLEAGIECGFLAADMTYKKLNESYLSEVNTLFKEGEFWFDLKGVDLPIKVLDKVKQIEDVLGFLVDAKNIASDQTKNKYVKLADLAMLIADNTALGNNPFFKVIDFYYTFSKDYINAMNAISNEVAFVNLQNAIANEQFFSFHIKMTNINFMPDKTYLPDEVNKKIKKASLVTYNRANFEEDTTTTLSIDKSPQDSKRIRLYANNINRPNSPVGSKFDSYIEIEWDCGYITTIPVTKKYSSSAYLASYDVYLDLLTDIREYADDLTPQVIIRAKPKTKW